jgi:hypothetical protein
MSDCAQAGPAGGRSLASVRDAIGCYETQAPAMGAGFEKGTTQRTPGHTDQQARGQHRVERSVRGAPVPTKNTSRMATGVAGPNSARTSVNSAKKRVLPAISFYCPPPALLLAFRSSLPHSSTRSPSCPSSALNIPQLLQLCLHSCRPHTGYQRSVHPPACRPFSFHAVLARPFFRRPKPLSLSLVYLSRKGFESQAPSSQANWTLTPESPSLSVSSRLRTGTTLPPKKPLPLR